MVVLFSVSTLNFRAFFFGLESLSTLYKVMIESSSVSNYHCVNLNEVAVLFQCEHIEF